MSIKIIAYLIAIIIQPHCVRLDKTGDDMSYVSNDNDVYDRNDHYNLNDNIHTKGYQLTTMIADEERTEGRTDLIKFKKWSMYSRNFSMVYDPVPAVRTDVIAQLQEQRSKHVARKCLSSYDVNYQLPDEAWPAITFSLLKLTSFSFPTPPSVSTLTFRDHFQSVRMDFRPKYNANLEFLSTKKRSKAVSSPKDISAVSNFWEHNFLNAAGPAWYSFYGIIPTTTNLRGLTNNPGVFTKGSTSNTSLRQTMNLSSKTHGEKEYYLHGPYKEDLKRHNERHGDVSLGMFLPFDPDIARDQQNAKVTDKPTTTRNTRTYPRPKWICYECGRNETKFSSPFCHDVFDNPNGIQSGKKSALGYRCIGNLSMAHQCFKRFVDVGYYSERGCRDWPPRTSGKTYASERLKALERKLNDTVDGCVFTPRAYLLSFSPTVQLYVRFHACVCKGTLCNGASAKPAGQWLIFIIRVLVCTISKILWEGL